MLGTLLFTFLVLMLAGVPVAFTMVLAVLAALLSSEAAPTLTIIPQKMTGGLDSFTLLAVPFFLLSGELMESGGLTIRIVRFVGCLVGHLKGGLMHVSIAASMVFAGISGSGVADASAIGSILVPIMKKKGYAPPYIAAVQAGAGSIGPIIPPSITMIVYASLASLSVAAMFLGGIIPGILIGIGLMIYNYFYSRKYGYEGEARASLKELAKATLEAIPALIMPGIILGGIVSGVFTATEAGAVACAYAALVGFFIYRELKFSHLEDIFVRATATGSMVMMIVAASTTFGWVLAIEQAPKMAVAALQQLSNDPAVVLALIMILLLVVGCFIDVLPAAIILIPVLSPIATQYNYDPIHFAVLVCVTLTIGLVTPPVGVVLYITTALAGTTLAKSGRMAIIPAGIMFVVCVLAAIFPPIITAIPSYFLPASFGK